MNEDTIYREDAIASIKPNAKPICTICGYDGEDEKYGRISSRIVERFRFCPNCGARMKGADDERDMRR